MRQAYIIAGYRSAVAPENGAFARLALHELAAPILQTCLTSCPCDVDEVVLSNALYGGGNPARMAALAAGLPETVAGLSIDRQCAGGLDAVLLAARLVQSGAARAVLAGGAESHSRRPVRMRTDPDGGPPVAYDRPPFSPFAGRDPDLHESAAQLADDLGITRAEQDQFAVSSHAKARAAIGQMGQEIVPLNGLDRDAFTRNLSTRTAERAPKITGSLSAANTAVKADAAAFLLVVDESLATEVAHLRPARIVAGATLGAAPETPATAPVSAIAAAFAQTGTSANQLSCSEVMEAYAVQAIACQRAAGLDPETMNRGGGALARGHPIGASGAINAVRLFHELQQAGGTGLAAIAAAGGLGTALLLEV
ncbi:thiolase family protein [Neptunicoccus cionae]|uniref:Acetyl-CoA acetyltransferase n=1 Tax=Neptunicoccus cionae TaxID=2035344 RepID=A0A916QU35_9RHOB|nr:thiolase family protein [Amylibacter cionae]GGA13148.1 acetyl-CoA acetyltransferase [Amylibacter cionae]